MTKPSGKAARAADALERFVESSQVWVAVAAGALLVLLQIPGVEDVLTKIGLENDIRLRTAIGVIILISILLELRQLKLRVTPAISDRHHYDDPKEMYNALIERAAEINDPEQRRIDVLGLTLFSAWPELEFFLERPTIHNWKVRLATLSAAAPAPRPWVPESWPNEAANIVTQIEGFRSAQGADQGHTIEIFEYGFMPVVHGFRLGNGDVFLSILRWRDRRLGKHRFPYDFVPAHDISPEAETTRALFENWFMRAVQSAGELAGEAGPQTDERSPAPVEESG
ncbi:MAG: hypothetical protein AB7V58_19350 [Solirubrobacterales bacterium]